VIWKKTKASNPDSFLLKVSLDKTLHTGVNIVQQAELVVGEEGGNQPRLLLKLSLITTLNTGVNMYSP
jgi:hypothetical protein